MAIFPSQNRVVARIKDTITATKACKITDLRRRGKRIIDEAKKTRVIIITNKGNPTISE